MKTLRAPQKLRKATVALVVCLLVPGCGPVLSIQPVLTPTDAHVTLAFGGTWLSTFPEGSALAVITEGDSGRYDIAVLESDTTGDLSAVLHLRGQLGMFGGQLVMEVTPDLTHIPSLAGYHESPGWSLLLPAHFLVAIDIGATEAATFILRDDWLSTALDAERVTLQNVRRNPGNTSAIILTDPTPTLRAALGPYLASGDDIWSEPLTWRRLSKS